MPYSPGGVFSLVASYFANPGTTIRTEQHNPVFEDVGSALSQVLIRDGRAPMTGPLNMNGFPINNVVAGSTPGSVATLAQAMPIGAVIDYVNATPPAGWMLCNGQAISRTTYAVLFALIGTYYGAGDGTTTFNLPDLRGRVTAGFDAMGGTAANRLAGAFGAGIGAQSQNIGQTQLPNAQLTVAASGSATVTSTSADINRGIGTAFLQGGGAPISVPVTQSAVTSTGSASVSGVTSSINGGVAQVSLSNVQPTMQLTKMIRVSYDA